MKNIHLRYQKCIQLLILFIASSFYAKAGVDPSYTVTITNPAFGLNYTAGNAKLFIRLSAENASGEYYYGNNVFSAAVDVQITAYDQSNNVIPGVFTGANPVNLAINQTKPELVFYKEFSPWLKGAAVISKFIVTTSNLAKSATDPKITTALNTDLKLEVTYDIDYNVDVKLGTTPKTVAIYNLATRTNPLVSPVEQHVIDFTWNNNGNLFPDYQFQLLKLSNTDAALYNATPGDVLNEQRIKTTIDWSKALTIETQSDATTLSLTMAEATGYYVWRVRPIGTFYPGSIADSRNWGQWSNGAIATDGSAVQFTANLSSEINSKPADYPFFFFHENDKEPNRIYSRSFSEENKVSEQVTYANGLNQAKQTQSYLPSMDALVIAQTLNDYSGRPALSTLPVPFPGQKMNGYKEGFVKKAGSAALYTPADYDVDGNLKDPAKVNDAAGESFAYYNGSYVDTKGNVPGAEGYAYSRTVFYNDGTGRVKEVAGPGARQALGDQSNNRGRTIRTLYSTPSDQELIRVFGDEAPDASRVLKTTTIDQNNTTSISYSTEGKVIATCISKNTLENTALLSLTDPALVKPEKSLSIDVDDAVKQSIPSAQGFKSIKRMAFSESTLVKIKYLINCGAPGLFSCGTAECEYDLKISVKNVDDLSLTWEYTQSIDKTNCGAAPNGYLVNFKDKFNNTVTSPINLTLPAGSYIIEKTLTPKSGAEANAVLSAESVGKEVQCYVDLVLSWLNTVKTPLEFAAFQQKINAYTPASLTPAELLIFTSKGVPPQTGALSLTIVGDKKFLTMTTSCCGVMTVPLNYVPAFTCPANLSDPNNYITGGALDFEGYLSKILYDNYGITLNYPQILPGYDVGHFNSMIRHMLTDQYKCSPTGNVQAQYSCEQLWSSWINAVNGYKNLKDNLNGNYSVEHGQGGGGADADNPPDGGNDTFDKNNDGILNWIIGKVMSLYMRNKNLNKSFEYNLAETFIGNVGYKFAEILPPGGNPLINTSDGYATLNFIGSPYINPVTKTNGERVYPNIAIPIFAFKYYEYADGSNLSCENATCYIANTAVDPCKPIRCNTGHEAWSCDQRRNFYTCIVSNSAPFVPDPAPEPAVCPNTADLQKMADNKNTQCNNRCEERRGEFKESIIDMFSKSCYTIGGCASDANNVSWVDIDLVTTGMVNECKANCNVTIPTCQEFTCGTNNFIKIEYNLCQLQNMERAMTSRMNVEINSKCVGATPMTCTPISPSPSCIPGENITKLVTILGEP